MTKEWYVCSTPACHRYLESSDHFCSNCGHAVESYKKETFEYRNKLVKKRFFIIMVPAITLLLIQGIIVLYLVLTKSDGPLGYWSFIFSALGIVYFLVSMVFGLSSVEREVKSFYLNISLRPSRGFTVKD